MGRVVLLLCLLQLCVGSRVLVVFPVPSRSHTVLGDSIVKTLLEAGHEVAYVSPSSSLLPSERLTIINISSVIQSVTDKERLSLMELVRNPRPPQKVLEVGATFTRRALQHNATQRLLADTTLAFDVVLAEWFFTGLLAPLASVYNCPLIWYSAVDASWMSLQLMHGHTNPAYTADPQARNMASDFSVGERASRLWRQAYLTGWMYYMTYYAETPIYHEAYRVAHGVRGRTLPDYEALVYNGSMLLVNSQPLLGQSLTLPQNAKYVGGHHIEVPTKPLSKSLQQLLDRSKNGVIFFSLGSNIKSKDLPERMQRKLLDLFGQLEQTVIWKFEEALTGLPRNVHVLKWAPQTSILNHTNTVLLITHGGFMSYMEATYFGVPIIGIPLFGDQFLTMDLVVERGRGLRVVFAEDLPYRIYEAIHKILGDSRYRSNARQASSIFRHTLAPPAQELLHWIELVLHHGADHLRSPAVQLSVFQKLHLDIVLLFIMFLWFCSKVLKVIRVHWNTHDVEDDRKTQ